MLLCTLLSHTRDNNIFASMDVTMNLLKDNVHHVSC